MQQMESQVAERLTKLSKEVERLSGRVDDLEPETAALGNDLQANRKNIKGLEARLEALDKGLQEAEQRLAADLEKNQRMVAGLQEDMGVLQTALRRDREELTTVRKELESKTAGLKKELENKLQAVSRRFEDSLAGLKDLREQFADLKSSFGEVNRTWQKAERLFVKNLEAAREEARRQVLIIDEILGEMEETSPQENSPKE